MKAVFLVVAMILSAVFVQADSKTLNLAGTVPVRGDVEVKIAADGKIVVQQNSPDRLKITSVRRGPASIVSAEAP